MRKRYVDNREVKLKLVYHNSHSFLGLVGSADLYKDKASIKHLLDLSENPQENFLHILTTKEVLLTLTDK